MAHLTTVGLVVALALPSVAEARRHWPRKRVEKAATYPMLDEPTHLAGEACGLPKLRADVDWRSFRPQLRDAFTADLAAGLCGAVMEGVKAACEGPRKLRPKKLRRVHCRYKRSALRLQVERHGKELWASYTSETPNLADDMRDWLLKDAVAATLK